MKGVGVCWMQQAEQPWLQLCLLLDRWWRSSHLSRLQQTSHQLPMPRRRCSVSSRRKLTACLASLHALLLRARGCFVLKLLGTHQSPPLCKSHQMDLASKPRCCSSAWCDMVRSSWTAGPTGLARERRWMQIGTWIVDSVEFSRTICYRVASLCIAGRPCE